MEERPNGMERGSFYGFINSEPDIQPNIDTLQRG